MKISRINISEVSKESTFERGERKTLTGWINFSNNMSNCEAFPRPPFYLLDVIFWLQSLRTLQRKFYEILKTGTF